MSEMNRLIRSAAGREPAAGGAQVRAGAPAGNFEINNAIRRAARHPGAPVTTPVTAPDETLRALIARDAGLPLFWGERLRGVTPDELAADAGELAEVVTLAQGTGPPPAGSFDGGARGGQPPEQPTFDSLIRAEIEARRTSIRERAFDFDHAKNRYRRGGNNA